MTPLFKKCNHNVTSSVSQNQNISTIPKLHVYRSDANRADFGMPIEEVRAMFARMSDRASERQVQRLDRSINLYKTPRKESRAVALLRDLYLKVVRTFKRGIYGA